MADELAPAAHLIDGHEVVAAGPTTPVVNPYGEKPMGSTPEGGADLVDRALASAEAAFAGWSQVEPAQRAALLERVAALIERDEEPLARLVTREMGMPVTLARITQSHVPAGVLRATAAAARAFGWRESVEGAELLRHGAGVVGAVTPWNMPVHQIIAKLSAAVAAGCSVVLKPSEQTPYDAIWVARLFLEAGAPAGLVNVVQGTGPTTGAALAGHPRLDRMSFTGSVRAGREVAALAGRSLTRCALELGGKSPAVVMPSADLDRAIPGAVTSGLVNSGQACNAPTRLLVPAAMHDEVADRVRATVAGLRLGDPDDEGTQQGPVVTQAQQERVLGHIAGAVAAGGRLLTGSPRPSEASATGWFVDPTVIVGLPEDAAAVREEIFGPVIVVQTYTDEADAVRLANDSEYGLSAEVWAGETAEAEQIAARLRTGQVKINGVRTRNRPAVPFGGRGLSGYGRELGPMGIEEFTDVTAVMA